MRVSASAAFCLLTVTLFALLKGTESVFGNYGFNYPMMPAMPSMFPSRFGVQPMMRWGHHAEWLPPQRPSFNPYASKAKEIDEDDDEDDSEEHDDDDDDCGAKSKEFDNSGCPGGWGGGLQWPCQSVKKCTTLRPRGFRAYCGWSSGHPLVCCPPADKASIHAEANVQNRYKLKPNAQPQNCGLLMPEKAVSSRRSSSFGPEPLIGGVPLRTAQSSPWMAAIGERTKNNLDWYCGGALISAQWVVTAAHCLLRRRADAVRVGELDFSRTDEVAAPTDIAVAKIVVHPDYKPPVFYHDIALIKLKDDAPFSRFVQPVCLPSSDTRNLEGALAVLTGWGDTEFGGLKSDVLMEVSVPIIPNERCTTAYSTRTIAQRNYPQGITRNLLCAGDIENGGKDACQGDSGAPLVMREGNLHSLIGIVSSGVGCGSRTYPGVYVRISSYLDWIKNVIK